MNMSYAEIHHAFCNMARTTAGSSEEVIKGVCDSYGLSVQQVVEAVTLEEARRGACAVRML